ncbi:MmgE/PrpD family protein [Actinoplanes sp. CA-142083]|uniref:MmgE/PrpD family protein n=1 Tax=Actinoplanes sp. CA-142083 TaxID=3239903 RepID=UPI003D8B2C31
MTAAEEIAEWAAGLRFADLPAEVVNAARAHLVDAVGCAVAGIRRGAASPALAVAEGLGGPPEARLFTGARLGAVAAAFGNAVAVHALDFDDTHPGGLVHASAVTVPVALAVGEQVSAERAGIGRGGNGRGDAGRGGGAASGGVAGQSPGEEMLTALVAGLETVCRLGAAAPHGFHTRGLHATSICGPVAAAVTAGRLYGLDAPTMTAAIGIAASGAAGLLEFLHSPASTKQLHPGTAVANGILAARLAAAGATGPAGALDGKFGLYQALAARAPDREVLLGGLGRRWETTRIAIKHYPCCQLSHASLDAARALAPAPAPPSVGGPIQPPTTDIFERLSTGPGPAPPVVGGAIQPPPTDIFARLSTRRVGVTLHPGAMPIIGGPEKRRPRSAYEAKFSVYFCVAAMLIDGRVDLDTFDHLDRPDLLDLAARIEVDTKDSAEVPADAPGIVTVNGRLSIVDSAAGPGVREKAAANLGPKAAGVFAAVDAGPDNLLDAIEGCLA